MAVHPSVVYRPEGWNGYAYWMAFTPYLNSNNQIENPSIVVSHDGETWVVPPGGSNPIAPAPANGYNSDVHLLINERDGLMYLFWREYIYGTADRHKYVTSDDGITWSAAQTIRSDDPAVRRLVAPSYVQQGDGSWAMYAVDIVQSPRRQVRATAATLDGPWTVPANCTITGNELIPWHVDVHRVGGLWVALVMSSVADGAGGDLWAMTSTDGLAWQAGPILIARGTAGVDWDASYYKSCLVPVIRDGIYGWDAWIGGSWWSGGKATIGRTFIRFDTILAELAAAAASRSVSDVLAAKNGLPPWLVGDSFARADAAALGNAETGQAWTASAGTFTIASKAATPSAAANTRAYLETGVTDHAATVQLLDTTQQCWLIARFVDGNNYLRAGIAGDGRFTLQAIVAGAVTDFGLPNAAKPASGSEITLSCVGGSISLYANGELHRTITNSSHATGTKVGLQAVTTAGRFRNFRARSAA